MLDFDDVENIKSEFLKMMPQYHFERKDFTDIFKKIFDDDQIEEVMQKCICKEQTAYFMFLTMEDEYYIIHMDSGTMINWYKHLGRTNTCNKEGFGLDDLEEFLQLVKKELFE